MKQVSRGNSVVLWLNRSHEIDLWYHTHCRIFSYKNNFFGPQQSSWTSRWVTTKEKCFFTTTRCTARRSKKRLCIDCLFFVVILLFSCHTWRSSIINHVILYNLWHFSCRFSIGLLFCLLWSPTFEGGKLDLYAKFECKKERGVKMRWS